MDKHFAFIITALIQRVRDFPPEALNELFRSMDRMEKQYDLIEPLTDVERLAIEEGLRPIERDGGIPAEEVFKKYNLDDYDRDAAGTEDLLDAISRVHKRSGEEQAYAELRTVLENPDVPKGVKLACLRLSQHQTKLFCTVPDNGGIGMATGLDPRT